MNEEKDHPLTDAESAAAQALTEGPVSLSSAPNAEQLADIAAFAEEDFVVVVPDIRLVLGEKFGQGMKENQQKYPHWPGSETELEDHLNNFYACGRRDAYDIVRIPLLLKNSKRNKDEKEIWLCTHAYYLRLKSSQQGDAYTVIGMARISLREHDELARGAVKLQVTNWQVDRSYTDMNQRGKGEPVTNGFNEILETWERVEEYKRQMRKQQKERRVSALTSEQEHFLLLVEDMIKITQECELARAPAPSQFYYDEVQSTDVSRQTSADVYKFHLSYGGSLKTDLFLHLKGNTGIRGKVIRVEDDWFTIRFGREIDRQDVEPENGPFETVSVQAAFRVQREAIEGLRTQVTKNPHLLDVLVNHTFQGYTPELNQTVESLNERQREAYQRALAVKDILLIQGPPGTGKTHTIAHIVQHYRRQKQRILITARTHKAVDNVLESLENKGLMVLRVGHEDKISYRSQSLLIESRAQEMREHILSRTAGPLQKLKDLNAHKNEIEQAVAQIPSLVQKLQDSERFYQDALQDSQFVFDREEAARQHKLLLQRLRQERYLASPTYAQLAEEKEELEERYKEWSEELELTEVGNRNRQMLFQQIAERTSALELAKKINGKFRDVQERIVAAGHEYESTVKRFETREQRQQAIKARPRYLKTVYTRMQPLHDVAAALNMQSFRLTARSTPADLIDYLTSFQQAWPRARQLLEKRLSILSRWHSQVKASADELHPVLIRRAEVIGATCIGSATSHVLADVDFDLVIVDEAGQINVLDLLVPLVRGKRTILVGDHQQLPPLVDNDVYRRIQDKNRNAPTVEDLEVDEEEDGAVDKVQHTQQMIEMLEKSVFELLFPSAREVPGQMITLAEQHRMPDVIARFVSKYFYDGILQTAEQKKSEHAVGDWLFPAPLAFIDTASLPLEERQEQANKLITEKGDLKEGTSYINPKEAEIIISLIKIYLEEGQDWVVIVPYRAQAEYIREELQKQLNSAFNQEFNEWIATVDSFQGGERAKIIYGFTRSNEEHRVGFLGELRRLNVALTRVREQLILVGDSSTLTRARHTSFRKLARALLRYIRKEGIYLPYSAFVKRLSMRSGQYERTE